MDAVMRNLVRARSTDVPPGLVATVRTGRRTQQLLPRLREGDIAVIDHVDLDRATAQALVAAGVSAVVNAEPMVSGRFPNQGPQVLLDAGVLVVDSLGTDGFAAVRDGRRARLHEGRLSGLRGAADGAEEGPEDVADPVADPATDPSADPAAPARGRVVDQAVLDTDLERARAGMAAQLETLTHTTAELLRREEDLLLHDHGLPRLGTAVEGRPVVVVTASGTPAELAGLTAYLREQHPVLVGVGAGADLLRAAGHRPDVVVVDVAGAAGSGEPPRLPPVASLKGVRDVVVRCERGGGREALERLDRLGVRGVRLETGLGADDAALLLADAAGASLVVGVGLPGDLADLLDRRRTAPAGTHLVRLRLGDRLVDAAAVRRLYSGRVRPWHLLVVMLVGLLALAVAVAVTPVGHEWFVSADGWLSDVLGSVT
jgi:uncharacterized membrane-anchored protein